MNKLIKQAQREINFSIKYETQKLQDLTITFWLEQMYLTGQIDELKEILKK